MREDASQDSTNQQQRRRSGATVPLGVLKRKEILVGEKIAVDAGQDNAGESVVLERAARHGLAAALEGNECKGREDGPADVVLVFGGSREGDDERSRNDEERLSRERDAEHPSPLGRKVTVEAGEEERSNAETGQRDSRFVETRISGRVDERCDAQSNVDGVSYSNKVSNTIPVS